MERGDKERKRHTNKMSKQKTNKPDFLMEGCKHYLSNWDKKKYRKGESIVNAMFDSGSDMPEGIEPWQPFEYWPPNEIADVCVTLAEDFELMFIKGIEYANKKEKA